MRAVGSRKRRLKAAEQSSQGKGEVMTGLGSESDGELGRSRVLWHTYRLHRENLNGLGEKACVTRAVLCEMFPYPL